MRLDLEAGAAILIGILHWAASRQPPEQSLARLVARLQEIISALRGWSMS
ncbi:hypothetical protein G3480_24345 [Thiorhodococcus mannitoliphagus]|uniref:Uncharacterized protein n=1 Tax=Thiorhodococcus mannitoliphagus TaxID=329406 RepID=A0A6P1E769_9GAMM|nr:hypothetical protein [Thiorhodococcus mannitoliphagus]NEX23385.1 hypothetical protein [Thiorhodococcus mannitoliphagus]